MIYDELTERDLYMYRRGEMSEYIRNHALLDSNTYSELYQWVDTGHSVHANPWGIWDPDEYTPCDYLKARNIIYRKK